MVREIYEKPAFDFQEMALFERVAAKCWGTSQLWLDINRDNHITEGLDIKISTSGGCQGSWSAGALNTEKEKVNAVLREFNDSETHDYTILSNYNTALGDWAINNNVTRIDPLTVQAESNWANTNQKSGGGAIIIGSN